MARFTQKFKVQSVEKALSRDPVKTLTNIADDLGVGYSTLQKWIRLAKPHKPGIMLAIINCRQQAVNKLFDVEFGFFQINLVRCLSTHFSAI